MKKKLTKTLIIVVSALILSGAGYVGDLPDISKHFAPLNENNEVPKPDESDKTNGSILPLDPKDIPDIKSNVLIQQKKYSAYYKDLEQIIPVLEKLKQSIENGDDIQYFNARAKTLDFYVSNLKDKYKNSREKNYDSYKYLISLNSQAQTISKNWTERTKNIKLISNYESNGVFSEKLINEDSKYLLNRINELLIILKEESL